MDVPPITPLLFYRDPKAALAFLERAFGFETAMLVDDGAGRRDPFREHVRGHVVMVVRSAERPMGLAARPGRQAHRLAPCPGARTASTRPASARRAAGGGSSAEPADQPYGDRVFTCLDPEGHSWSFGQTVGTDDAARRWQARTGAQDHRLGVR